MGQFAHFGSCLPPRHLPARINFMRMSLPSFSSGPAHKSRKVLFPALRHGLRFQCPANSGRWPRQAGEVAVSKRLHHSHPHIANAQYFEHVQTYLVTVQRQCRTDGSIADGAASNSLRIRSASSCYFTQSQGMCCMSEAEGTVVRGM